MDRYVKEAIRYDVWKNIKYPYKTLFSSVLKIIKGLSKKGEVHVIHNINVGSPDELTSVSGWPSGPSGQVDKQADQMTSWQVGSLAEMS